MPESGFISRSNDVIPQPQVSPEPIQELQEPEVIETVEDTQEIEKNIDLANELEKELLKIEKVETKQSKPKISKVKSKVKSKTKKEKSLVSK